MNVPLRVALIMAGGSGERFWPLSRRDRPKQLQNLASVERSLLAEAVDRILPLIPAERVFVITARHLQSAIAEARTGVPPANVLAEPCKRNTSGCLAYAAAALLARFGCRPEELSVAVLTADHRIGDPAAFRVAVNRALAAAEQQAALVTLGVRPTRPETGFGYMEMGPAHPLFPAGPSGPAVYPVLRFIEKPCRTDAERLAASGRFLWNSGMFFWRLSTFLHELGTVNHALADAVQRLTHALQQGDTDAVDRVFGAIEDKSIDYALMERARRVLVVPAQFDWDDIGAWDALDRSLPRDDRGNVAVGDPALVDTHDCVVYNAAGSAARAVAVVGVSGLVVVVTDDGVLVIPKARAQDVRSAVAELRRRGASQV